jgi:hypothetical protein
MNETKTNRLAERVERAAVAIIEDLSLLVSLYTARVIVWHTLRRREREWANGHAERRKKFQPSPSVGSSDENKRILVGDGVRDLEREASVSAPASEPVMQFIR